MPIINTAELAPNDPRLRDPCTNNQVYCGLDTCVTLEVHGVLSDEINQSNDPAPALIYGFEKGMQAPALDIMTRGLKVDQYQRKVAIADLERRLLRLNHIVQSYARAIWDRPLNPNSPEQLKQFFYYDPAGMKLPEQHLIVKGIRRVSTGRECLEKLMAYFYAVPVINAILAAKDLSKKLSSLKTAISADGRIRCSYGVASTETGRWNSSADAFGEGTNMQNWTPELRRVFIADEGWKLCNLDLQQAESWIVGLIAFAVSGDESYLNACRSGDLHTVVAKLVWPHKFKEVSNDREAAEQVFYRQFTFRDMAKRGGHATNYYGKPRTVARHLKVEERIIADFQGSYFGAFPGIPDWHGWVAREIGINQCLTTPLGRRRHFFGRPGDDATLREAIAYIPQSVVGDLLNTILWQFWKFFPEVKLLAQVHDSILFQFPEGQEESILPRAMELAKLPISFAGTEIIIPSDVKIGWNWADDIIKTSRGQLLRNPDGLVKWKSGVKDGRIRATGLDRVIS